VIFAAELGETEIIAFAVTTPERPTLNEILVRPTAQPD
jgi:hypothetical protein